MRRSLELIMHIGHEANLYFSDAAPWSQIKTDKAAATTTLLQSCYYGVIMGALLNPFLPHLSHENTQHFSVERSS